MLGMLTSFQRHYLLSAPVSVSVAVTLFTVRRLPFSLITARPPGKTALTVHWTGVNQSPISHPLGYHQPLAFQRRTACPSEVLPPPSRSQLVSFLVFRFLKSSGARHETRSPAFYGRHTVTHGTATAAGACNTAKECTIGAGSLQDLVRDT
ncbi:hypothetical protein HOY80DRAFT_1042357 [Tuber brumale]|nr:hypothetical protein HOY80DRAFT_1042357 [Tuber brumale]